MPEIVLKFKMMEASGVVSDEPAFYGGFTLGTDSVNKPIVTVYDNASAASGQMMTPTAQYDATADGLNGHEKGKVVFASNGIYFDINEAGGTQFASVYYRKLSELSGNDFRL